MYIQFSQPTKLFSSIYCRHVDAGKSTLIGHLLYEHGDVSSKILHKYERQSSEVGKGSFAFAGIMDETQSERDRGVTIDIAERCAPHTSKCISSVLSHYYVFGSKR